MLASPLMMRYSMQLLAFVQGLGGIVLGVFTWTSVGDANGDLTVERLWPILLTIGGVAALGLVWRRNETTWTVTDSVLSTGMLGRGIDILLNLNEFIGRPGLAVAIWVTMGMSTLAAWAAVGAMAGWPEDG